MSSNIGGNIKGCLVVYLLLLLALVLVWRGFRTTFVVLVLMGCRRRCRRRSSTSSIRSSSRGRLRLRIGGGRGGGGMVGIRCREDGVDRRLVVDDDDDNDDDDCDVLLWVSGTTPLSTSLQFLLCLPFVSSPLPPPSLLLPPFSLLPLPSSSSVLSFFL